MVIFGHDIFSFLKSRCVCCRFI